MKFFSRLSYRRIVQQMDLLGLRCPSKSALQYTARRLDTRFWQNVLQETCGYPRLVALDATGLSKTNPSYHYLRRIDGKMPETPIKLNTAFDVETNKFCSARVRMRPRHDIIDAKKLLRPFRPEAVLADKGYCSDDLFRFIDRMRSRVLIPLKKNMKLKLFRRRIQKMFDEKLYHKRSRVESAFSAIKRKYGHSVSSRRAQTIRSEVYGRLVCHNLFNWIFEVLGQSRSAG